MNGNKFTAIILFLVSLGAIQETNRILTSDAPDIANNRASLIPMAIVFTLVLLFFALRFWRKGMKQ